MADIKFRNYLETDTYMTSLDSLRDPPRLSTAFEDLNLRQLIFFNKLNLSNYRTDLKHSRLYMPSVWEYAARVAHIFSKVQIA